MVQMTLDASGCATLGGCNGGAQRPPAKIGAVLPAHILQVPRWRNRKLLRREPRLEIASSLFRFSPKYSPTYYLPQCQQPVTLAANFEGSVVILQFGSSSMSQHDEAKVGLLALSMLLKRDNYTPTRRIEILTNFRNWIHAIERSNGGPISDAAVQDVIADLFYRLLKGQEATDPLVIETIETDLDPKTISKLRTCELDLRVSRIHPSTFRVLDAFCFLMVMLPPPYLTEWPY
jgi:hypothetical protein